MYPISKFYYLSLYLEINLSVYFISIKSYGYSPIGFIHNLLFYFFYLYKKEGMMPSFENLIF